MKSEFHDDASRKTPPLSLPDVLIYLVLIGIWLFIAFRFLDVQDILWEQVRFPDASVLAVNPQLSEIGVFPLWIAVGLCPFVFLLSNLYKQTPIFGNSKIQYGEMPWKKNIYPLFWKDKPAKERTKKRSAGAKLFLALKVFVVAAVILFCYTIGLFCRDSLVSGQENILLRYDSLNREAQAYSVEDIASMTVQSDSIKEENGQGRTDWSYAVEFLTRDGARFSFTSLSNLNPHLGTNKHTATLEILLDIKHALSPGAVTITGAAHVEQIMYNLSLDFGERELLLDLFGIPYEAVGSPSDGFSKAPLK